MTEVEEKRPGWMIELENRKRKPRLAHEAGAGSPCLSCKEACPGLDLHFWRKICKNCKCGRDEHDVVDDEFPQFDLLLGPSGRTRKKATFLPVTTRKQAEKENAFDWVPPDVTTEIAAGYMKALPENKLPIQGSVGAALRKQQLQKQLPLHDMDHKACDKLSEDEKQQFEKYLENLKKYVGQGKVSKVMGAQPFTRSLMTPANAADMQPMSPQRKPQAYLPTSDLTNLRTPSSFILKAPGVPTVKGSETLHPWIAANLEAIQTQISESTTSTEVRPGQYHPVLDNVSAPGQIANSQSVNSMKYPAYQFANTAQATDPWEAFPLTSQNRESAPYIPDFGKVNFHTEYSQIGENFESNAPPDNITPIVDCNIDNNVPLDSNLHAPNMQVANVENIPAQWNVNSATPVKSGKYHSTSLPLYHTSEVNAQRASPGMLNVPYSDTTSLRKTGKGTSNIDELRESSIVPQDVLHSENIALVNAQLAEQMLCDALRPPSAIHANEIIGSTLDKNKLKFIQQQLSAKYSKEDTPSQQTLISQGIETVDPQFGQSIGKHKNVSAPDSFLDKKTSRAAIIDAMRNPSGYLADHDRLHKVEAKHENPLNQSGQNEHPGLVFSLPRNDGCESEGFQKANSMGNNEKYSTAVVQNAQMNNPISPYSAVLQEIEDNRSMEPNKFQQQYLDNTPSSVESPTAISGQQQQYLNLNPELALNSDKLSQGLNLPRNISVQKNIPSNYPSYGKPGSDNSLIQPNYSGNTTASHDNEWSSKNPSLKSYTDPLIPPEQLHAELNYQPVNSHLIHSQSSGNPSFPEGIIDSPGLRHNPASVDQLRGALEELSVGPVQLHKCTQCKEEIHSGDVVVTAERAKDAIWHPGCFICSTCNELLVDLVYFYHKGKLYCGRDLAALLNIPRCFACDELIFVREYTVAEGHNYHVKHFCCWDCDVPLAGQRYISENDRPLCLPCYQKTYAKTCKTCNKIIAADQQGVAVKNLDFHASDTCFSCFTCKKSLLSGKMAIKEDRPFCSKECITEFLSNRS